MMPRNLGPAAARGNHLLLLALSAVCFAPLIEGGTTYIPVFILKLIVLAMLLLQTRLWLTGGQAMPVSLRLDFPLALVVLAALISLAAAPYKNMALTWVQLIIYYCLFYLLARTALRGRGSLMLPVAVLMFMAVIEMAVAVYQWHLGLERVSGTFFNPNMLAGYITVPAVFALSLIVNGDRRVAGRIGKALLAALFMASLATIILSGSRGGLVSFMAGSFIVLWLRSRRFSLVFAALLAVSVLLVPNPVKERVFSDEPFAYSRAGIWKSSLRMAADHPMGVGLGNFKYQWDRYNFPIEESAVRYGKKAGTAHNEYLHFTAETGIPGLMAIFAGIYVVLGGLWPPARSPASGRERSAAVGALGGVTAVLVHSALDSNFHEPGIVFMFIFTVCIGMEAGALQRARFMSSGVPEASKKRLAALVCVLAVLLAAWAVKQEAARYYFEKGGQAMKSSGPAAALMPTERAVFLDPSNAAYRERAASVQYALFKGTGDETHLKGAFEELFEAERLNPDYSRFPAVMASIKAEVADGLGDPAKRRALIESAIEDMGRALGSSPFDAELTYRKAALHERLGETGREEELLTRLRELEPNFLRGRYALALLYSRTGRNGLSRDECYSIIRINEGLSKKRLGKAEAGFVAVDMEKVESLLESAGGA